MEEFEILTNVLLSNCENKAQLQEVYVLLTKEIDKLTLKRQKELEGGI